MFEYVEEYFEDKKSEKLAQFNKTLTPGGKVSRGIKVPDIRKLAKIVAKDDYQTFMEEYPEEYLDQELLKAFTIGYVKDDLDAILKCADEFVPKIHDWSVNDAFCQNFSIARKYPAEVFEWLMKYIDSEEEFEQRVVSVLLMSHFLNEEYVDRIFKCMDRIDAKAYYSRMGIAWCVATAMAKFPEKTFEYLEHNSLDEWTWNKSIQKMRESYRVTEKDKARLKTLCYNGLNDNTQ